MPVLNPLLHGGLAAAMAKTKKKLDRKVNLRNFGGIYFRTFHLLAKTKKIANVGLIFLSKSSVGSKVNRETDEKLR